MGVLVYCAPSITCRLSLASLVHYSHHVILPVTQSVSLRLSKGGEERRGEVRRREQKRKERGGVGGKAKGTAKITTTSAMLQTHLK